MNHPSRNWRLSAVTLAAAAMLAACGGSDDPTPTTPATPSVTIKRDSYGTPRIYADDTYSLFFGMGYAVAEDRLYQWEMIKRMARGTMAEALGAAHVEADKAARKSYDARELQRQIDALPSADRDILQGWADGYNKRLAEVLANRTTLLSKQFTDMGVEPTPIAPLDLVAAYFRGSLANFADSNSEVLNLGLLNALKEKHGETNGKAIFDQLRWKNDPTSPTTIGEPTRVAQGEDRLGALWASARQAFNQWLGDTSLFTVLARFSAPATPSPLVTQVSSETIASLIKDEHNKYGGTGPDFYPKASNMWALSPARIEEGQAAFYIGPQYGNNNPTNAFGVGLHGAGYNAIGTSHWGFPMIMWGANDKIGWGVTVGFGDTVDMFQLTLNPANRMQYRHKGEWKTLTKRVETIKVKGAEDVTVEYLVSHYGQIDSIDEANNVAYARGRTWAGREVDTLIAWSQMNKAQNWDEYVNYGRRIAASLNWFYIDAQNNIGTAYVGAFMRKDPSHDFRLPLPGDGSADWLGPLPFSEHPTVFNPASGDILNWNNKVSRNWDNADYQFWGAAHHVDVIKNIVNRKPKLSLEEFRQINKAVSLTEVNFAYFKPFLVEAVASLPAEDERRKAVDLLATWDGVVGMTADKTRYNTAAYAIFRDWLPRMLEATLRDDIPDAYWAQYRNAGAGSSSIGVSVALSALRGSQAGVPQTYDFFNGVDKYQVIRDTLQTTVNALKNQYGADMTAWLMPLTPHTFSVRSLGSFDVNTADQALSLPINMARGTANHMVTYPSGKLDYADVIAPGQSGFIAPGGALSPNYKDQLELYGNFTLKPGALNADGVTAVSTKTLSTSR